MHNSKATRLHLPADNPLMIIKLIGLIWKEFYFNSEIFMCSVFLLGEKMLKDSYENHRL
jgi:hypothetical protein